MKQSLFDNCYSTMIHELSYLYTHTYTHTHAHSSEVIAFA